MMPPIAAEKADAMPRNFLQRTFMDWLAENRGSFCRKPIGISFVRGGVEFRLEGLPHGLSVHLGKNGAIVSFSVDDEVLDLLVDFEVVEHRGKDGYYRCELCVSFDPDNASLYAYREVLWQMEVFDPLLQWINANFQGNVKIQVLRIRGATACSVTKEIEQT